MTNYISQTEAAFRLGITDRVQAKWRAARKGPRAIQKDHRKRFQYDAHDVERLRAAILELGKFGLSLTGVEPLRAPAESGPHV